MAGEMCLHACEQAVLDSFASFCSSLLRSVAFGMHSVVVSSVLAGSGNQEKVGTIQFSRFVMSQEYAVAVPLHMLFWKQLKGSGPSSPFPALTV